MSTQTKNFLWSYARSFLAAALALWFANGGDIWSLDVEGLKTLVNAGIAAVVPPILRALNENDPAFGKGFLEVTETVAPKKTVKKRTVK